MKRLALSLALVFAVGLPGAACAQVPDSSAPPSVAPDVAAVYLDPDQRIDQSEQVLREIIASGQAGPFTHPLMSEGLLANWLPNVPRMAAVLQGFGAVVAVEHVGLERGAEVFDVTFQNDRARWILGFNDDGRIGILAFGPPPAPEPEPLAAPDAPPVPVG